VDLVGTFLEVVSCQVDTEYFMLYKYRPPAVFIRPTAKSMPQLDFREALSAPNEKLFSSPEIVTTPSSAPSDTKTNVFARGVQFSRSTWANIFFVTIASVGGLACAFYFFNGGELLRAAAAWPNEFLYPRPLSTEKIDIGAQLNAVDQFVNNETGSTKTDETKAPLTKNVGPSDFSQPAAIGASNPTVTAPVGPGTTLLPATPALPAAPLVPGGVNVPSAPSTDSVLQSLSQTATSITPTKTTTRTAGMRSSTRRKVLRSQPKVAGQTTKSATAVAQSTTQQMQQMSHQTQAPLNGIQAPNQMTMGGGLGGGIGGAVGGAVGGVGGGLGGGLGGLGGGLGGLPGHH
jgi:hypothetical protein